MYVLKFQITVINATVSESIRDLDLSFNMLRSTSGIHGRLRRLSECFFIVEYMSPPAAWNFTLLVKRGLNGRS